MDTKTIVQDEVVKGARREYEATALVRNFGALALGLTIGLTAYASSGKDRTAWGVAGGAIGITLVWPVQEYAATSTMRRRIRELTSQIGQIKTNTL